MPNSPALIVGSPRSGTSALVDVLFAAGYNGYREGHLFSLITPITNLLERQSKIFGGNSKVMITEADMAGLQAKMIDLILEEAKRLNPTGPWLDKTGDPPMLRGLPLMLAAWPGARVVFARRRGLENIASRLRKFVGMPFQHHCRDWAENMRTWRAVREVLPAGTWMEVDQQDMIQRPEVATARLTEFLGLDDGARVKAEAMMRGTRAQQTQADSAVRVHSITSIGWTDQQVDLFRQVCGPEMEAYGYSLDESYYALA